MSNVVIMPHNTPVRRVAQADFSREAFAGGMPQPVKRAAEAIKNIDDINRIVKYLKDNKRYRDHLIFVMGINFGLRASDLLRIKVGDVLDYDPAYGFTYKQVVTVTEQKTSRMREDGTYVYRYHNCYMNEAVMDALDLYLSNLPYEINLNDVLFQNYSNNSKGKRTPLTRYGLETILKKVVNEECGVQVRASTHMLRKTFAYHILMNAPDRYDAVTFLMKVTGHQSRDAVLHYIGVTDDEIKETCEALNLGRIEKVSVSNDGNIIRLNIGLGGTASAM